MAGVETTIDRWFPPGFVVRNSAMIEKVRTMIAVTPVDGYCGCGATISCLSLADRLRQIDLSILVIAGEDDQFIAVSMAETISRQYPRGQVGRTASRAVTCQQEDVVGFNAALCEFLDDLVTKTSRPRASLTNEASACHSGRGSASSFSATASRKVLSYGRTY